MIEIKRWDNGEVIHSGDFFSIKECLEDGVEKGVSFYRANLTNFNLKGANLNNGIFNGAHLNGTNFNGAHLNNVNLNNVRLWGCIGNGRQIKSLFVSDFYPITYTSKYLQIGCERHSIVEWCDFNDERILDMDGPRAVWFRDKYKSLIIEVIKLSPAMPAAND